MIENDNKDTSQNNQPIIVQEPPILPSAPKSSSVSKVVFASIFFILLIEILGYFGYKYYMSQHLLPKDTIEIVEKKPDTITPKINPISDWITYTGSYYNFAYPDNWHRYSLEEENNPTGSTFTLVNYDAKNTEKYIKNKEVQWSEWLGNKEAIKIEIKKLPINTDLYLSEGTLEIDDHNIVIGGITPTVYELKSPYSTSNIIGILVDLESGSKLNIDVYGFKTNSADLMSSDSWNEISQILSTFELRE